MERLTIFDRLLRRISPEKYKNLIRRRRAVRALQAWGGANIPPDDPIFSESMYKIPSHLSREYRIIFQAYPHIPILVRAGTADPNPFRQVFLEQQYSGVRKVVEKAAVILDLGANVGYSVLYFGMFYPEAMIYAVEPLPENCQRIKAQVEIAGISSRVRMFEAAVGNASGNLDFFLDQNAFFHTSGSLIPDSFHTHRMGSVKTITIDSIFELVGDQGVDILKVDIEGAESEIFLNPAPALGRLFETVRAVAMEIHDPAWEPGIAGFFTNWVSGRKKVGKHSSGIRIDRIRRKAEYSACPSIRNVFDL